MQMRWIVWLTSVAVQIWHVSWIRSSHYGGGGEGVQPFFHRFRFFLFFTVMTNEWDLWHNKVLFEFIGKKNLIHWLQNTYQIWDHCYDKCLTPEVKHNSWQYFPLLKKNGRGYRQGYAARGILRKCMYHLPVALFWKAWFKGYKDT